MGPHCENGAGDNNINRNKSHHNNDNCNLKMILTVLVITITFIVQENASRNTYIDLTGKQSQLQRQPPCMTVAAAITAATASPILLPPCSYCSAQLSLQEAKAVVSARVLAVALRGSQQRTARLPGLGFRGFRSLLGVPCNVEFNKTGVENGTLSMKTPT